VEATQVASQLSFAFEFIRSLGRRRQGSTGVSSTELLQSRVVELAFRHYLGRGGGVRLNLRRVRPATSPSFEAGHAGWWIP